MTPKSLGLLAAVTVVVVAAAFLLRDRGPAGAATGESERLLPELSARVNDVVRLEVTKGGETAVLEREGDDWVSRDVSGYPAKFETVKEKLVALTTLEILEAKTKKPENYAKLGVQDPDAPDSESALVVLKDAGGSEVARLIVGNSEYSRSGRRVYVRRAGDAQVYLCKGDLTVEGGALTWIDKEILRVASTRVRTATITHADGEVVSAFKGVPSEPNFAVADVPLDRSLKHASVGSQLGNALAYLSFEDVKPAGELALAENRIATAEFVTFDGLIVDLETAKIEEDYWITLNARLEPPPDAIGPTVPTPEGEEAAEPEPAPPVAPEKLEEVRVEAEELNARTLGWAFRVPSYKGEVFARRLEDLLAEPVVPEEPTGEPAGDTSEGEGEGDPPVPETADEPTGETATGEAGEDAGKPEEPAGEGGGG